VHNARAAGEVTLQRGKPGDPVEAFAAEAPHHPVFRLGAGGMII
jgi:hypothetical protein